MMFRAKDEYYWASDCGNYTVCRIADKFEAWFHGEQLAVGFNKREAAEAHCEWHFNQQQHKAA